MGVLKTHNQIKWEAPQVAKSSHKIQTGNSIDFTLEKGVFYKDKLLRSEMRTFDYGDGNTDVIISYDLEILTDATFDGDVVLSQLPWDGGSPSNSIRYDGKTKKVFYTLFGGPSKIKKDLFTNEPGKKYSIIFSGQNGQSSNGKVLIYVNGVEKFNHTGRNIWPPLDGSTYVKIGAYKDFDLTVPNFKVRFSNVTLWKPGTTIQEILGSVSEVEQPKPPIVPPVTPPKPEEPKSPPINPGSGDIKLTFVNAQTERDIHALEEGAKISLQEQGTHKISVRADVEAGSVTFNLNKHGKEFFQYTDNEKPFSLWGDAKSTGNYYYGDGMSEGFYVLRVSAYTGKDGSGDFIASKMVNFDVFNGPISENNDPDIEQPPIIQEPEPEPKPEQPEQPSIPEISDKDIEELENRLSELEEDVKDLRSSIQELKNR